MKYSAESIIVNKYPESRQLPNGKWEKIWDIVLKKTISRKIDLKDISQELSSEEIFDKDYESNKYLSKINYIAITKLFSNF